MTGFLAVCGTSLRLLRRDAATPIVMVLIPLVLVPFLIPGAAAQLRASGYPAATGAEQVVPGFTVLFAFLAVQQIVTGFGREHQWGTWDRLRAAPISTAALLLGRGAACMLVQLLQIAAVMGAGALVFGYRVTGSVLGVALVLLLFSAMLVTFGFMLVAVFRSAEHALVAASLGGMVLAGVGGALAPVSAFPAWAQTAAMASPAYWALDALRRLSLDGAGLADALPALGVLLGCALLCCAITVLRFRPAQAKVGVA